MAAAGNLTGWNDHAAVVLDSNKRLRAGLTPEEKAEFERERNRIHARNTRARKKQFIEELKAKVEALRKQQEEADRLTGEEEAALVARHAAWVVSLERVFKLRSAGDGACKAAAWKELLAPGFRMTLPLTPYREYGQNEVVNDRRVVQGPEGMAADAASLMALCSSLASRPGANGRRPMPRYSLGPGESILPLVGQAGISATYRMVLKGVAQSGVAEISVAEPSSSGGEVALEGLLRATFAADGRLAELDLAFDPIAFYNSVYEAAESHDEASTAVTTYSAGSGLPPPCVTCRHGEAGSTVTCRGCYHGVAGVGRGDRVVCPREGCRHVQPRDAAVAATIADDFIFGGVGMEERARALQEVEKEKEEVSPSLK